MGYKINLLDKEVLQQAIIIILNTSKQQISIILIQKEWELINEWFRF